MDVGDAAFRNSRTYKTASMNYDYQNPEETRKFRGYVTFEATQIIALQQPTAPTSLHQATRMTIHSAGKKQRYKIGNPKLRRFEEP